MISVLPPLGDIALLRLDKGHLGSRGFQAGLRAVNAALAQGRTAILLDVCTVRTLRASDMARVVELASMALPAARLALVNAAPSLITSLRDYAIDEIVPVFASMERALKAPEIRRGLLAHVQAVVLCAGKGTRIAPLTQIRPKPMLDIMGRPILEHILSHLKSFGVRDVVLNPGHLGPQITHHFGQGHRLGQSIFYLNEGRQRNERWVAAPLGSASTLARWKDNHNGMARDTIVICGDALTNIDLAAMVAHHRRKDADITLAAVNVAPRDTGKYGIMVTDPSGQILEFQEKPAPSAARSTLANAGIYVMSPRVAQHLDVGDGADIATDLLPAILASGGRLESFQAPFEWIDIGCGRDYAAAWQMALDGALPWLAPDAERIAPSIWAHPTAQIGRLADIEGPAFISAGAQVAKGASLRGPVVLGAGAVAEPRSYLRNAILMEGTRAAMSALIDGMIAHGRWAVAHAFADGSPQSWEPLEGVSAVERDRAFENGQKSGVNDNGAPRLAAAS